MNVNDILQTVDRENVSDSLPGVQKGALINDLYALSSMHRVYLVLCWPICLTNYKNELTRI